MYHPSGWDMKYTKSLYYSGCKSPPAAAALDSDERLGVRTSTGGCKAALRLSIVAGLPGPPGAVWGSASSARPPAGRLTKKAPAHAHEVTLAGDSSPHTEREGEGERERVALRCTN